MKISQLIVGMSLICSGLLLQTHIAKAAPGDSDTGFSGDGRVTTNFGGTDVGRSIALQSDGKIIVVGETDNAIGLARYNTNGSLDTSFDSDGTLINGSGSDNLYRPLRVIVQSDGKILVGGYYEFQCIHAPEVPVFPKFFLKRFNSNGTVDTTFDTDGNVFFDIGSTSYGQDFALQSDGKIVMVGNTAGTTGDFIVARFTSSGALDTTFSSDGWTVDNIGSSTDVAHGVALQSDGKIVVAGESGGNLAVARYTTSGALDTTFSSDGKDTVDLGTSTDFGFGVAIQSDGKIVIAGTGSQISVVRYTTSGALDTTFSSDGIASDGFGSGLSQGYQVALQSNGKIVIAGHHSGDFAIARYTTSGALDTTFSDNGHRTMSFSAIARAYAVAIQSDGKIVAAGSNGSDFGVGRFEGDTVSLLLSSPSGSSS